MFQSVLVIHGKMGLVELSGSMCYIQMRLFCYRYTFKEILQNIEVCRWLIAHTHFFFKQLRLIPAMIFDQLIAIAKSQNINNEPNISSNICATYF